MQPWSPLVSRFVTAAAPAPRLILNHLSYSAQLMLVLSYLFAVWTMGFTCIMVVCSLIHWWREEASSLNCSNFFCASASKRGWPGGGSEEMRRVIWILRNVGLTHLPGNTSYNWETYVMIDFSSGSGVSTSEG